MVRTGHGTTDWFQIGKGIITADGYCSHEIKSCLLLGRKVMTNLESILKSRGIALPTDVHLAKAMVFPVVMYGCESWTVKKAEHQRIDGFELWCWRRLLRILWTARKSNQSILRHISHECPLEGLMLQLKLQYFGYLMLTTDSLERTWCWEGLKVGGEGDEPTWWTQVWASPWDWWWTRRRGVLQFMGPQRVGQQLSDGTEILLNCSVMPDSLWPHGL